MGEIYWFRLARIEEWVVFLGEGSFWFVERFGKLFLVVLFIGIREDDGCKVFVKVSLNNMLVFSRQNDFNGIVFSGVFCWGYLFYVCLGMFEEGCMLRKGFIIAEIVVIMGETVKSKAVSISWLSFILNKYSGLS